MRSTKAAPTSFIFHILSLPPSLLTILVKTLMLPMNYNIYFLTSIKINNLRSNMRAMKKVFDGERCHFLGREVNLDTSYCEKLIKCWFQL